VSYESELSSLVSHENLNSFVVQQAQLDTSRAFKSTTFLVPTAVYLYREISWEI